MLLILRDTREQKPLSFDSVAGVDRVEDIGLPFGDYAGMIGDDKDHLTHLPLAWDRKSIGDLYGTMTHGYDRFKRAMHRAKESKHKLILIVEGTYSDVEAGYDHSEFSGDAMIKKLATLYVKYDLETWFCESRKVMAKRIVDTLLAVERNYSKGSIGKEEKHG
jgi:hypothetical protein